MVSPRPGISVVMPVMNEEKYLRAAVASIFEQNWAGELELLLVLGVSKDSTNKIAEDLAAADSRIRLLHNPKSATPISLNLGFEAAKYAYVVRVDAHSELSDGYLEKAFQTLERPEIVNVGGIMRAEGETAVQQAVAWAYNNPQGLGGGVYHLGGSPGPADSVYLGCFKRDAVLAVSGFDPSLKRGQDWELNYRLKAAGGTVWFAPELQVTYRPRSSFAELARQFFKTGAWRAEIIRRHQNSSSLRYLVPPALVLSLVVGLLFAGISWLIPALNWLIFLAAAPYLVYLIWLGFTALTAKKLSFTSRLLLPPVLAIMHLSWGSGFLVQTIAQLFSASVIEAKN